MAVPTLDELRAWFNAMDPAARVCRVMVKDEIRSPHAPLTGAMGGPVIGICGRAAVGIDRLGGKNALVCEAHQPREMWFVRLSDG